MSCRVLCASGLVCSKLGFLDLSPGPLCSASVCLGLSGFVYPGRLIYDLSRAQSNRRRKEGQRDWVPSKYQWCIPVHWKRDWHTFPQKHVQNRCKISAMISYQNAWVWGCRLNVSSFTALYLFFNVLWTCRHIPPSVTVQLKCFSPSVWHDVLRHKRHMKSFFNHT